MGKHVDAEQMRRSLGVALCLREKKFKSPQIQAILESSQAQAEKLYPYKEGALRASFSKWDRGELKSITQADIDSAHDLATRLTLQDEADVTKPDNSAIQCKPQATSGYNEATPKPDNSVIHRNLDTGNTVLHGQEQIDTAVIQCQTDIEIQGQDLTDNLVIQRKTVTTIPETDLLLKVKEMLSKVEVTERPGDTAPGRKSTLQTKLIAARFPVDLIEKLDTLGGKRSHHLEKALMLYLRAMDVTEPTEDGIQ